MAESAGPEPAQLYDSASFAQVSRGPVSVTQLDQSALNYSGGQEEKSLGRSRRSAPTPALCTLSSPLSTFYPPPSGIKATVFLDPLWTSVALARRATAFIS